MMLILFRILFNMMMHDDTNHDDDDAMLIMLMMILIMMILLMSLTWIMLKLTCQLLPDLEGMNLSPYLSF